MSGSCRDSFDMLQQEEQENHRKETVWRFHPVKRTIPPHHTPQQHMDQMAWKGFCVYCRAGIVIMSVEEIEAYHLKMER